MQQDPPLDRAREQVEHALVTESGRPVVKTFFDEATFTASHVAHDPATGAAAIIDSVMDFDQAAGRTSWKNADRILDYVRSEGLQVQWLLETHAHADHLSAAPYLQQQLGGKIAIGEQIRAVQQRFATIFNEHEAFSPDGSQFDRLFADGDSFAVGTIEATVLHVPGHTPADVAYVIGDAAFVGDTMFMPDYGSARCDFPGGCARQLYGSIRRLTKLPDATRVFLCHDYKAPTRDCFAWETTIGEERANNMHVRDGVDEESFVQLRTTRDATLTVPKLLLPAIQVNMRAGRLPPAEENGASYLKIPLNMF